MNLPLLHKNEAQHPIITKRKQRTFGQKAADTVTKFLGSWKFIIAFLTYILFWMGINTIGWVRGWDPYPFILLNLTLSCLAAFQAPMILMSQNRQSERDRITAQYDYAVNRKAEREVRDMQKDLEEIKTMLKKLTETTTKTS